MTTPPALPTEAQVYAQYQTLLEAVNHEILNNTDDDVCEFLQPLSQELTDLLDSADMVHLEANTAAFTALTPEMKAANEDLKKAQTQIDAIAGKLADAGKVISALGQVLSTGAKFL